MSRSGGLMSSAGHPNTDLQIPRSALLWLLGSNLAALLPHGQHLPLWMWGLALFVLVWRGLTHLGRLSYPNRWAKAVAVFAASAAVVVAFEKTFTLESAAAFLIAASLLKLLEMRNRRDGYVVVFLSYFLLGTGFLFDQGILAGLYGILTVWLLTSALVALHQNGFSHDAQSVRRSRRAAKLAAAILLMSLPLMLVLYLLFPRLAPLWSMALQSGKAKTGLSAEMAPGDIADLSQSDELAFRVSFSDGQVPARDQLYWRALVLDDYDGRRWQPSGVTSEAQWYPQSWQPPADAEGLIRYEIIQEATSQKWLFALRGVAAQEERIGMTMDDRLVVRRPLHERKRYQALSWPSVSISEDGLAGLEQRQNLQLPRDRNPQARAWAQQRRAEAVDDATYINGLLRHFREQDFYYTLKPPLMGSEEIDDFLFNQRRGFCAHYAGALVFLARAAGIPARVVSGYQGGEWNAADGYLTVRQYDAHAWTEVWLSGQGWVRVDPTAAVAPQRIEFGLERAVAEEGTFLQDNLLSPHRFKGVSWLNRLRMEMDSLNYYWQLWVLSYDGKRQKSFLNGWLGLEDYQQGLYVLGGSFGGFFLLASLIVWWRQRPVPLSPFMRSWQRLQEKGQKLGVEPQAGETAGSYLQRLEQHCPQQQSLLRWLAGEINRSLYQPQVDKHQIQKQQRQLLHAMAKVRRQLRADRD